MSSKPSAPSASTPPVAPVMPDRDGEDFLRAYHREHPGATARAFARGTIDAGVSSYDRLAEIAVAARAPDAVAPARGGEASGLVVDLGCGDGHGLQRLRAHGVPASALIGIDMSPEELAAARARPALAGVGLVAARAQCTPLERASAACVVSHMAFMLMRPAEAVVAEIARVLRPGGVFATIVGGGPLAVEPPDAFGVFLDLFVARMRALGVQAPRLGDPRTRTDDGLAALLGAGAGFEALAISDLVLRLDGPFEAIWESLSTIYESRLVGAAEMAALRGRYADALRPLARPDGAFPCAMRLRLVTCRRATTAPGSEVRRSLTAGA